jgi:hypothetical protein
MLAGKTYHKHPVAVLHFECFLQRRDYIRIAQQELVVFEGDRNQYHQMAPPTPVFLEDLMFPF